MNDPYMDTEECVRRLYADYKAHGKLIVAVDYDDTLFDFHKKGHTYTSIIDLVKQCQELGFYVVIFTGAPKEKYPEIKAFCGLHKINIEHINENPIPLPFGNNGKIFYNILLDDRAGLSQAATTLIHTIMMITRDKIQCEIAQEKS